MNKYYEQLVALITQVVTAIVSHLAAGANWLKTNVPALYDLVAFVLSVIGLTAIFAEHTLKNPVLQILGIALALSVGLVPVAIVLSLIYVGTQVAQLLGIKPGQGV